MPFTLHSQWIASHRCGGLGQLKQYQEVGRHPRSPSRTDWCRLTLQVGLAGLQLSTAWPTDCPAAWRGTGYLMLDQGFDFVTFLLLDEKCEASRLHVCPQWLTIQGDEKTVFACVHFPQCIILGNLQWSRCLAHWSWLGVWKRGHIAIGEGMHVLLLPTL